MESREAWIALSLTKGVGEVRLRSLVDSFGSPEEVFRQSARALETAAGLPHSVASRIAHLKEIGPVRRQIQLMERLRVKLLTYTDPQYPENLRTLDYSPPMLWVRGEIGDADRMAVAIVGSRRATIYGRLVARSLAAQLANRGITVVSGMARGIDTVSHKAALDNGGRTIAVLGSGVDVAYPPENRELMERIADCGAVVSEFPMSTRPIAGNFPTRNRVISGLSLGVIAVEAGRRSGVLSTARWAAEQGRDVFAIPGNISSAMSVGTNSLIQQGAKLTTGVNDVLEELHLEPAREDFKQPSLSADEALILDVLTASPRYVDEISADTGLSISSTLTSLLSLEMKDLASQLPGKLFVNKDM